MAGGAGVAAHPAARRVGDQSRAEYIRLGFKGRTPLAGAAAARAKKLAYRCVLARIGYAERCYVILQT
jgi:hypothetical protein